MTPATALAEAPTRDASREGGLAVGLVAFGIVLLPLARGHTALNLAPADVGFICAIVGVLMWAGTNRYRLRAPYVVGMGLMVIAGVIAAVLGEFPRAGVIAVGQDLYLLLWGMAVANVFRVRGVAQLLLRVWSYTAIVAAALIVVGVAIGSDALAGINRSITSRAAFTFPDENSAGIYFAISLAIVLATRTPKRRGLRAGVILLLLAALLVTGSLAGLLALGVTCVVAATVGAMRRFGGPAALALVAAIAVVGTGTAYLAASTHVFDKAGASSVRLLRDSLGRETKSSGSREVLIREISGLYFSGPLVGRGPASTRASLTEIHASYPNEAHDDYLATITERGVLGGIGLILLIAAVKLRTTALDTRVLRGEFVKAIPRPAWLIGAVASLAFVALTHEILHERTVWSLLGVLAGIHAFGLRSRARYEGTAA